MSVKCPECDADLYISFSLLSGPTPTQVFTQGQRLIMADPGTMEIEVDDMFCPNDACEFDPSGYWEVECF